MGKLDIKTQANKWKLALALLLILHLILLFNLKFTAWPEMQLWPYLILKGWLPYRDIAMAHTPVLILELSLFNLLFGTGLWQLKVYTWLVVIFSDLLIFFVVKKLWGVKAALASVFFYIFAQTFYEGNGLWFDLVLGFYAIALYYLARKKEFLLAGILWAFSFLSKQTAFWFLFPLAIMFLQGQALQKLNTVFDKVKKFILGVSIVIIPVVVIVWALGIWSDFWFWAVEFGIGILPRAQGQVSFPQLRELLIALLPFSILPFLLFIPKKKEGYQLIVWTVFSALGVYPRWGLFHFQPALPFLAIVAGLVLSNIKKLKPFVVYTLSGYLLLMVVLIGRFYAREWGMGDRFFEPEVLEVVDYIKDKSESDDKIYVLNAWDSVYALSDTLPARRPWIPHLPWYMELPGVQEKIVTDLESEKPEMIVAGEYTDFGLSSYKPELIDKFITENYEISDKIDGHLILLPKE
jgi:hypothetical protein